MNDNKYEYVVHTTSVGGGGLTLMGLGLPDVISILIIISILLSIGFTIYRWYKLRQHYKVTGCKEDDDE